MAAVMSNGGNLISKQYIKRIDSYNLTMEKNLMYTNCKILLLKSRNLSLHKRLR